MLFRSPMNKFRIFYGNDSASCRFVQCLKQEDNMPMLVVPLLIDIPFLIGGGYFVIKAFH